ncbi:Crp/Fnr family transcriptional regulator [Persicobacter sp. CCB-QB2]|uniref:Crp/Fnr family transcriptional regulator n=1 Tax=Persicobacter sp. CCB-QB2 TaxID=1561025 RepID=UPI0006A9B51A|nr:cyclic nucleotide-binding domain-containing protein [Persicobacter sp. CCB-QB2]
MKSLFKKPYDPEDIVLFDFLQNCPLLSELTYQELSEIKPLLYEREFQMDEAVYFRNDPSQVLYIIKSGEVTMSIDIEGNFEELGRLGPFSAFGKNAILPNTQRTHNALITSKSAEIYAISGGSLQDLFEKNPEIENKMLRSLSIYYNDYMKRLFQAYKKSKAFFELKEVYQ